MAVVRLTAQQTNTADWFAMAQRPPLLQMSPFWDDAERRCRTFVAVEHQQDRLSHNRLVRVPRTLQRIYLRSNR
jgi:hypothetical protein